MASNNIDLAKVRKDILDKLGVLFLKIAYDNYSPRYIYGSGGPTGDNKTEHISLKRDFGYLGPKNNIDLFMMEDPYPHALLKYTLRIADMDQKSTSDGVVMFGDCDIAIIKREGQGEPETSIKCYSDYYLLRTIDDLVKSKNYKFITAEQLWSDAINLDKFAIAGNKFLNDITQNSWRGMSLDNVKRYNEEYFGKDIEELKQYSLSHKNQTKTALMEK